MAELLRRVQSGQALTLAEYARVEEALGSELQARVKEATAERILRSRTGNARAAALAELASGSGGVSKTCVRS
jgi:hypothetical protein